MSDLKSQRDTKPGKPEPKSSDRMPPGYCMFVCDRCGCHSRWYALVEQGQSPLREIMAGLVDRTAPFIFDNWEHRQVERAWNSSVASRCSACASTLPYVPEPVKAVKK